MFPGSVPINPASIIMSPGSGCPCAGSVAPQVASTCQLQPVVNLPTPSNCVADPPTVCVSCGPLPPQDPYGCLYPKNKPMSCCSTGPNYNVPWFGDLKKSQLKGLCGTVAGFYPTSSVQNSVHNNATISLDAYHTKLYATTDSVVVLPDGFQIGSLKSITYVKGSATVIVTSAGNKFVQNSSLVFKNVGDNALLLWSGTCWVVLATYNLCCNEEGPYLTQVSFTQPCAPVNAYPPPTYPVPIAGTTGPTGGATGVTGV
jgi:hypothetical protein